MRSLAPCLILPCLLLGACTLHVDDPRPDATGVVAVSCSDTVPLGPLADCERRAQQACGGAAVREVSRSRMPSLGRAGDVDLVVRYRCELPPVRAANG